MGKKGIALIIMLLVLIPAAAFSLDLEKARIGYMKGDVQLSTKDNPDDWFPAALNTPLQEGDRIWVPDGGRSEVQILGGVAIRLDAASSFDILSLGEDSFQFFLNEGRAYLNNRGEEIDHIQVDTPYSSIGCYDNARAMIDVDANGATYLSVLSGYAFAETRNGKIRVDAGNTLRIAEDLTADMSPLNSPDEWENWNVDRDRRLAGGSRGLRYLPDELGDYVNDFEDNGRWIYAAGYGYVWSPTAAYSYDWAPYRLGRWVWIGGDYVWISTEQWGWAPYHYGRWIHLSNSGWCWVPPRHGQVYWSPGYVGWVHTPSYVSWVPLGPRDTYYGRGHYGPGSVNVTNVSIGIGAVNLSFQNVNIRNAVTVQQRDTFLSGRKSDFRTRENPFASRDAIVGPPTFKPQHATLSPALKLIPRNQLPPEKVRFTRVDTLKKERRIVTDQRQSVFTPGRPARDMRVMKREDPVRPQREQRPENMRDMQRDLRKAGEAGKERATRQQILKPPAGTQPPPVLKPAPSSPDRLQDVRRQTRPGDTVRQPVTPQQNRGLEMERERKPQRIDRGMAPQGLAPTPSVQQQRRVQPPQQSSPPWPAPRQQQIRTPQPAPEPAVRQPASSPAQQFRGRPPMPAAPAAQPQPARIERQQVQPPRGQAVQPDRPRIEKRPVETQRQPAAQPQFRGFEMKRDSAPQAPARIQTPQQSRPVSPALRQQQIRTPQPVPEPAVRQPATPPAQQFRGRPPMPAAPAAQPHPARIERQQPQQPVRPGIGEQARTPGNAVKNDNPRNTQGNADPGGPPAANPGRQMREGGGWR